MKLNNSEFLADALPMLYSRTSTGAVQTWMIEVDGARYRTIYGQVDGKKTTTEWYYAQPTNVGRANERNEEMQALFEAAAIFRKRTETGYHTDIRNIDKPTMIDCMLAQKFEDREKDLQYPVYSQPKLDGIRCLCTATTMFSRQGKIFKSAPHILKALESFFKQFPDAVLDGELYCDKLNNDFNKIVSLVRKTKPTQTDLDESAGVIQYWVYDVIDTDKKFTERHKWLAANLPEDDMIVRVETSVAFDKKDLDTEYESYMSDGYEGQMVRTDGLYERKRSKTLLKRKEFQDAEYEILEIGEGTGNRTGMAGFMVLKNKKGENFNSNIKGSHEFLADLFQNKEKYIGEKATVQFFHLSPYGIPRFPYVTSIRNYE